jgi:hypothetical protein
MDWRCRRRSCQKSRIDEDDSDSFVWLNRADNDTTRSRCLDNHLRRTLIMFSCFVSFCPTYSMKLLSANKPSFTIVCLYNPHLYEQEEEKENTVTYISVKLSFILSFLSASRSRLLCHICLAPVQSHEVEQSMNTIK